MGWLLLLGVVALAIFSRGFRGALIVVVVLGGAGLFLVEGWNRAEDSAARTRVARDLVVLEDLSLARSYSSYSLSGRLRNNDRQYTVNRLIVRVTLRDCRPHEPSPICDIVGETDTSIFLDVPPGQVREIDSGVYFSSGTIVRNQMQWDYTVVAIYASNQ
jgi:hypothetical protein